MYQTPPIFTQPGQSSGSSDAPGQSACPSNGWLVSVWTTLPLTSLNVRVARFWLGSRPVAASVQWMYGWSATQIGPSTWNVNVFSIVVVVVASPPPWGWGPKVWVNTVGSSNTTDPLGVNVTVTVLPNPAVPVTVTA